MLLAKIQTFHTLYKTMTPLQSNLSPSFYTYIGGEWTPNRGYMQDRPDMQAFVLTMVDHNPYISYTSLKIIDPIPDDRNSDGDMCHRTLFVSGFDANGNLDFLGDDFSRISYKPPRVVYTDGNGRFLSDELFPGQRSRFMQNFIEYKDAILNLVEQVDIKRRLAITPDFAAFFNAAQKPEWHPHNLLQATKLAIQSVHENMDINALPAPINVADALTM